MFLSASGLRWGLPLFAGMWPKDLSRLVRANTSSLNIRHGARQIEFRRAGLGVSSGVSSPPAQIWCSVELRPSDTCSLAFL